ncbi:MAG: tail fiber protein [Flavobacteriales bacterium]|nr:tail fiber protein [Flavobacteriales bacterium]
MSQYVKAVNFATKDGLLTGDPLKIVSGTEINDEYNAIQIAVNSKANSNSPVLTGNPTTPTASALTNTTQIASTQFVTAANTAQSIVLSNAYIAADVVVTEAFETADQVLQDNIDALDLIPVGSVFAMPHSTLPEGFLVGDGSAVSRTTYSDLFALLGTVYGVGDGSTTFELPDYRAGFLRGLDSGKGVDTGRSLGTSQVDQANSIEHFSVSQTTGTSVTGTATVPDNGTTSALKDFQFGDTGFRSRLSMKKYGRETRPLNQAVVFVIKY